MKRTLSSKSTGIVLVTSMKNRKRTNVPRGTICQTTRMMKKIFNSLREEGKKSLKIQLNLRNSQVIWHYIMFKRSHLKCIKKLCSTNLKLCLKTTKYCNIPTHWHLQWMLRLMSKLGQTRNSIFRSNEILPRNRLNLWRTEVSKHAWQRKISSFCQ